MKISIRPYLFPSLVIFTVIILISMPVHAGTVKITNLEYPESPETLSMEEIVPIVVTISYTNMEESTLVLSFHYADDPNRGMPNLGEVVVSGSGTYTFPPIEIAIPGSSTGFWDKYINEWNLKAEIWKRSNVMKLRDSKPFTLLVENPTKKPDVEIGNIEYVTPPDTIALGEETLLKLYAVYSNLEQGTKIEATLRDKSGIIDTGLSRALSGSGQVIFTMTGKPREVGSWNLEVTLASVTGSLFEGDKNDVVIWVVAT